MKNFNQFMLLICLIPIIGCNSGSKKTNNNQSAVSSKSDSNKVVQNILGKDSLGWDKKPTTGQLYSAVETKLNIWAKTKFDSSTIVKHYKNKIGNNECNISCYFSSDRLISIENRITGEKGEDISFMMFHFDAKNNCFANYRLDNEKDTSRFYIFINNYVIEYDYKLRPFIVDSFKKNKVIRETKASLESNMQRFPEFKYSFNWK